jgi:hypothetical protein
VYYCPRTEAGSPWPLGPYPIPLSGQSLRFQEPQPRLGPDCTHSSKPIMKPAQDTESHLTPFRWSSSALPLLEKWGCPNPNTSTPSCMFLSLGPPRLSFDTGGV